MNTPEGSVERPYPWEDAISAAVHEIHKWEHLPEGVGDPVDNQEAYDYNEEQMQEDNRIKAVLCRLVDVLEKDKARLDWLEKNLVQFLGWHPSPDMGGNQWTLRLTTDYRATRHATRTARAAIDAAMRPTQ